MEAVVIAAIISGTFLALSAGIAFYGIYYSKKKELKNTKEIETWKKNLEIKWAHIYPNVVKNYNDFIDLYVKFNNYYNDFTSPGVGGFTDERIKETQEIIKQLINLLIVIIKMDILIKIEDNTKEKIKSITADLKKCLMNDAWLKNPQTSEHVNRKENFENSKLMIGKIEEIKNELPISFSEQLKMECE
jgi:hypothetical protein